VILDLGSNVGYTIAYFKALYPSSRIIGAELDRANYELCLKNIKKYSNCRVFNIAIWKEDGSISYGGPDEQSYAIGTAMEKTRTVPSFTVQTLLALSKVKHVHYLKMDIEGAEIPILRENPAWLDIVDAMRIEVHEQPDTQVADSIEEVCTILTARGFICIKDAGHWSNVVAIRSAQS
jgi:FkbM family methyltransferase